MKKAKRLLASLMVAVLMLTVAPLSGLVGFELPEFGSFFSAKAEVASYSGTCGSKLNWSINTETGELVIDGSGKMKDYKTETVPWYSYSSTVKTIVISDGVTSIGNYAFSSCSNLECVTIGDGVTLVGLRAFYNCDKLKIVNIKDISLWCNITFDSYYSNPLCNGGYLFLNGEKLTDLIIPDGITALNPFAFCNCKSLISVSIPDSITTIGYGAFYSCSNLEKVNISDIAAWCNIPFGHDLLEYPYNPLENGADLYLNGEKVSDLVIPDGATSIGDNTFSGCTSLTSVTIPDSVTSIGQSAFCHCTNLENVTIGNGVTSIGSLAFYKCPLVSVTMGNSVTSIGMDAFEDTKVTKVYITDLFSWCNITFGSASSNPLYDVYYASSTCDLYLNGEKVTDLAIPDGISRINSYAFYNCDSIESVTIPDSVKVIDEYAFSKCYNISDVHYSGEEKQWNNIIIETGNDSLLSDVRMHYNYKLDSHYETVVTLPTCTERGYTTYTCECGYSYVDDYVSASGHSYETVVTAPTCNNKGYTTHTCSCGHSYVDDYVDATGHSYTSEVTIPATHTSTGLMTHTCSCGYTYTSIISRDYYHSYIRDVTRPTCTEQGYTTYICYECGDSYVADYVDAKGHTEGKWVVTKPATSTQTGIKTLSCSVCGAELKTEIIPVVTVKGKVHSVSVSGAALDYKGSTTLNPQISVDAGVKYTVSYSSSNPSVASVDANGKITTKDTGSATITVTVTDEYGNTVSDTCNVEVKYNWWQWILVIVLFGWIWY